MFDILEFNTHSHVQVLALSVREAIEQSIECLERVGTTGRQDLCTRGGHSTDGE